MVLWQDTSRCGTSQIRPENTIYHKWRPKRIVSINHRFNEYLVYIQWGKYAQDFNITSGTKFGAGKFLYPRNENLLESWREVAYDKFLHWDEASGIIIKELWKEFQETYKLWIIKNEAFFKLEIIINPIIVGYFRLELLFMITKKNDAAQML